MKNKIILYGIIVIAVLLVAFNLNKITGMGTAEEKPLTSMTVEKVRDGSKFAKLTDGKVKLTIYGIPGNCVDRTLSLNEEVKGSSLKHPLSKRDIKVDMYGKTLSLKLCERVDIEYNMQGRHGNFYFEATDLNTGKLITAEFSLP